MSELINTPGGYSYVKPTTKGKPDVNIALTYEEAYDIVLDGLKAEASIEPITPETFDILAENLLGLLIDSSDDIKTGDHYDSH